MDNNTTGRWDLRKIQSPLKEYLEDLLAMYMDGKYIELNIEEFSGRFGANGSTVKMFDFLFEHGLRFYPMYYTMNTKDGKKKRVKKFDTIAITRNYCLVPQYRIKPHEDVQ